MHEHFSDNRRDPYRPKGDRIEDQLQDHQGRAAAEGRADVLGAQGLLDLQRVAGNAGVSAMVDEERSPVHDVVATGGRALDPEVRADMEGRLGADFGDVRVHDDGTAAASATSVNAHAYTVGSNIVFQRDVYDPASHAGRTTLAHELTHVIQQRSGPVDGTSAAGGIKVSDPGDRFEREASANADRVMSSSAPAATTATPAGPAVQRHSEDEDSVQGSFAGPPELQRQDEEEEEPVQGLFVQREGEEEEEEVPA